MKGVRKQKNIPDGEEEIMLDADTGEELEIEGAEVATSALHTKLKKIRDELKACQKERDENLTGWQRAKADLANFRRITEEDKERDGARARGKLVKVLVPALDSFDSALTSEGWESVDKTWREGVERTVAQLHKALESEGLERFADVGDAFDPTQHDCMSMQHTTKEEEDHTIAQVLQKGYRIGPEVVRPAKVTVYQLE